MKIFLASYFETDNHGPGRKIGISPSKPNDLSYDCDFLFKQISPGQLYWDYHKNKKTDAQAAADIFNEQYENQLKNLFNEAILEAKNQNKTIFEILPFKDGDTLLSWEKKGNISYRTTLAGYLREIGYEVEEN